MTPITNNNVNMIIKAVLNCIVSWPQAEGIFCGICGAEFAPLSTQDIV